MVILGTEKQLFLVKGRNNVSILNNTFTDFDDHAVDMLGYGTNNSANTTLAAWATGNKINYNTFTNSAGGSVLGGGYFRGAIEINSQDGLEVIGNTCTQTGRGVNGNGWCMKMAQNFQYSGGLRRGKILYNNFSRDYLVGDSFAFLIESTQWGDETEVAYNTFQGGALDINSTVLNRGFAYALDYHDNLVGSPTPATSCAVSAVGCNNDIAVILEFHTNNVWIRHNTFRNTGKVLAFEFHSGGQEFHDIHVENNVGYKLCGVNDINSAGTNNQFYNIYIINNTFSYNTGGPCTGTPNGIVMGINGGVTRNLQIKNNIIVGFPAWPVVINNPLDGYAEENNIYFNNGFSNSTRNNSTITNNLVQNITTTDPLFNNGSGSTVTAGSFVVGKVYTIISLGTTSFTSIGASSNTVGLAFTATGVGTGTGTAGAYDFSLDTSSPAKTTGITGLVVDDTRHKLRSGLTTSIGAFDF
jgi:hypothetical protein